uniref:PDZ domain-containing protein n=1 Tax=Setaria digitata TaxID=48799 RepID=A0A915PK34_9BILA
MRIKVNGKSLEGLNHSESVRTLVKSGSRVKIKLIRFLPSSPQAECLNMLQRQVIDVPSTLPDVVADWKHRLGPDFEVVSVDLIPDKCEDGGLGISLEGTVDILNGTHLCPHHYIDSLRPGGPAAFSNALRSGDELLQANDVVLYGESHVTVRQALIKAASNSQRVRLTVARKVQTVNVFMPRPEESLPIAYPLLAATDDRLVKAKSETCISKAPDSTTAVLEQVSQRLRSRSLQLFNGLAIWRCVPMIVQLEKDSRGLGFSIVDYRVDPLHPGQSVVVVRSLVPGGLAQADGRIIPGDRLMFINDEDLSNSTLEHAVAVLKSAPDGLIRLGIAKPIPIEECGDGASGHSPLISRSERVLAKGTSPRSRRRHRKQVNFCNTKPLIVVFMK